MKKTLTTGQIVDRLERVIAQSMFAVYDRAVQEKLTWRYLGIQSNTLRSQTHAVSNGNRCILGTIPWYGHAYETGNWSRWKGREGNDKKYKRSRRATWTGDKKHRPFMRDTIKDLRSMEKIARRVRVKLRAEGIMR